MKHFLSVHDIDHPEAWVQEALQLKQDPLKYNGLGKDHTLGLLFFNNSLRTRVSTVLAAQNLGLNTIVMNFGNEGWQLEYQDGTIMDAGPAEHVREAAAVMGQYCDIIGIRAFAKLENKEEDLSEPVITAFKNFSGVPILNLESALEHPLQALTDAITIGEYRQKTNPKVVLSWAPHPRALPHAVANSFASLIDRTDAELVITHPEGYELDGSYTGKIPVVYDQAAAMENADFVYVKNWSSFSDYGAVLSQEPKWMMTSKKLGSAYFMHCLPVRRNVVVEDAVLDSEQSLAITQAGNRTVAAQLVLKKLLDDA